MGALCSAPSSPSLRLAGRELPGASLGGGRWAKPLRALLLPSAASHPCPGSCPVSWALPAPQGCEQAPLALGRASTPVWNAFVTPTCPCLRRPSWAQQSPPGDSRGLPPFPLTSLSGPLERPHWPGGNSRGQGRPHRSLPAARHTVGARSGLRECMGVRHRIWTPLPLRSARVRGLSDHCDKPWTEPRPGSGSTT